MQEIANGIKLIRIIDIEKKESRRGNKMIAISFKIMRGDESGQVFKNYYVTKNLTAWNTICRIFGKKKSYKNTAALKKRWIGTEAEIQLEIKLTPFKTYLIRKAYYVTDYNTTRKGRMIARITFDRKIDIILEGVIIDIPIERDQYYIGSDWGKTTTSYEEWLNVLGLPVGEPIKVLPLTEKE